MPESAKFDFYEKVRIFPTEPGESGINGELGAIVGRVQDGDGAWSYAVYIYRDKECWSVIEADMHSTGEFDSQESFSSGTSIRVSQHGELLE